MNSLMALSAQPTDVLTRVIQRIAINVVALHSLGVSAMATATRAFGRGRGKDGLGSMSAGVGLRLVAFVLRIVRATQACGALGVGERHPLGLRVRTGLEANPAKTKHEGDLLHAHARGDVGQGVTLVVQRADDSNLSVRQVSAFSSHRSSHYTTVGVFTGRLQTKAQAWAVAHGWSSDGKSES